MNLRESTIDVANTHIKKHLEEYWKDIPIEHIDMGRVNLWARMKRAEGLSWVTIKNILRTLQRVVSCFTEKAPPFSLKNGRGFVIPQQDRMDMEVARSNAPSFSWSDTSRIAKAVHKLDGLDKGRKSRYATAFLLAAATGLRCSELFALRIDDVNFRAGTIRVDEAFDGRTYTVGKCKNSKA
jgi:integrase